MRSRKSGFTLLELLVVLAILAAMAGLIVPLVAGVSEESQAQATNTSLMRIRNAIMGTPERPGYWADKRQQLPAAMRDLFINPDPDDVFDRNTRLGWHGPYLQHATRTYTVDALTGFTLDYGSTGDPAASDGWNHPIIIQIPADATRARLLSAGSDGVIQTSLTDVAPQGDDLVLFLRSEP